MSNIKLFAIDPNGPAPRIHITYGHANWGAYDVWLYDNAGKNPLKITSGVNTDDVEDIADVGHANSLNGRMLYWRLRTARFDDAGSGHFNMKVTVSQEGREPHVQEYDGAFTNLTQDAIGIIRFTAA